jgi:hypothetical protein
MKNNIVDHRGMIVTEVKLSKGYWKRGDHFYHVHENGITHVHIDLINHLDVLRKAEDEQLEEVTEEIFAQEVRNAVFNIGIYKYVR